MYFDVFVMMKLLKSQDFHHYENPEVIDLYERSSAFWFDDVILFIDVVCFL